MSQTPTKVLVLGIDAANPALLRSWAEDGSLPNLASLLSRGVSGTCRSVDGFFVGSTWPSFYTGVTPAKHGFHYLVQLMPGSYEFHWPADHGIVRRDPFWSHLSEAGRRVAILDVPLTRLDPSLNGVHVVEWGSHDSVYGFQASPSELEQTLRSRFGDHPLGTSCDGLRTTAADYQAFVDALLQGVRSKGEMTKELLGQGGWDLFIQVFTESHCVGHQCWHLSDPSHPAHDPDMASALGDPMRRVYSAIDTAIGEVLAEAGDAMVVVLSAHGMSHWHEPHFLLRDILVRLGASEPVPPRTARSAVHAAAVWAWRHIPRPIRRPMIPLLRRLLPADEGVRRPPAWSVRPESSRCFPLSNGLAVGGIRLNLKGREPQGVLEPGVEADAFCRALTVDLLDIVDERTGEPVIRRVQRVADHFEGEHVNALPDLLVHWSDSVPIGSTSIAGGVASEVRVRSPKIGVVEGVNEYGRTGEHRVEGMFVAAGPGIRPARLEGGVSVLDFAPTIAEALGVELPDSDGRSIPELVPDRGRGGGHS